MSPVCRSRDEREGLPDPHGITALIGWGSYQRALARVIEMSRIAGRDIATASARFAAPARKPGDSSDALQTLGIETEAVTITSAPKGFESLSR